MKKYIVNPEPVDLKKEQEAARVLRNQNDARSSFLNQSSKEEVKPLPPPKDYER
jgi:hypothetical protein